ncbi:hypothetical protein [Nitrosospira multiformis]|uniref:Uncharacterized protein n=1 Tax=Nitrosospira multiformis (strain ATCC 25196 / NCIMB 11849 / C 71) TaxID=323848 RepID=Q2YCQ3_NITMU|nr:hypothetical protein [Nitrosospira multiformis]ABB73468.1 hypothetical protein Nmul_A0160 [Nitrosospira multiformis ATCC 25196]SEA60203.1 hypothetical protein SAMN05216411_11418 [Nitrosospira multiformis]SEG10331.1 hypothetical protein SAMN05216403_13010 [Nitrosospira multiformis ATCC 25196]
MMRRAFIPAVIAVFITGIVILGFAAALYHSLFFYKADGVMSRETAKRLGLLRDDPASFPAELAFRKSETGGYFYRKGGGTAFIDETSYTTIDLIAGCERLGGCQLRK